jgi:16S rRNA (guanine966-N2)-methyltransferase
VTRIVAGQAGGRRLVVPVGADTRPTSERAREGLFSTLEALNGPLTGARILDLYAGSGALGLEALSRGAATATFVESDPKALQSLRANVAALGFSGAVVVAHRAERWVARVAGAGTYDVVLADPPYRLAADRLAGLLIAVVRTGLLTDGVAVVERSSRDPAFGWPTGWISVRTRRYGEATLWYGRRA